MILTQATGLGNTFIQGVNIIQTQLDVDVIKFLNVIDVTLTTNQINALNELVFRLKGYNLWDKCDIIYPFIGGTANSHSYNLIDITKFQITFNGSWNHTVNGSQPAAATGNFANTGYSPLTEIPSTATTVHMSIYHRGVLSGGTALALMGVTNGTGTNDVAFQLIRSGAGIMGGTPCARNASDLIGVAGANNPSFYMVNRSTSNTGQMYINGILTQEKSNIATIARPTRNIYINGRNVNSDTVTTLPSYPQAAFVSVGKGSFDIIESLLYYNIIQDYQTKLNRQV
jgi:hypothetical protein